MDLGRRFRFFREQKGLSQKEAAELIGVKYYQLGNYETNRSEPSIAILKKMSKVYEISIDGLVGNMAKNKNSKNNIEIDNLLKQLNEIAEEIKAITERE